jgi:hypothetical protein
MSAIAPHSIGHQAYYRKASERVFAIANQKGRPYLFTSICSHHIRYGATASIPRFQLRGPRRPGFDSP